MKIGRIGYLRLEKGRVDGYEESHEIPLSVDVTLIGRPPMADDPDGEIPDVKIRDDYISRGHVGIHYSYDDESFVVQEREAGARNGTFLNG